MCQRVRVRVSKCGGCLSRIVGEAQGKVHGAQPYLGRLGHQDVMRTRSSRRKLATFCMHVLTHNAEWPPNPQRVRHGIRGKVSQKAGSLLGNYHGPRTAQAQRLIRPRSECPSPILIRVR